MTIYSKTLFKADSKIKKETILEDFLIPRLLDEIEEILRYQTKLNIKETNFEDFKEYITGVNIIIEPLSVSKI